MKKSLLLFVAVLLLFGWGCRKKQADNAEATNSIQVEQTQEVNQETALSYTVGEVAEENEKVQVDVKYPVFSDDKEEAARIVNDVIKPALDKELAQFKSDYNDTDHEYDPGPWFFEYDFEVARNDGKILSVVLRGSIYTGGAHPNQIYRTFVFDMRDGAKLMELTDVFNPLGLVKDAESGVAMDWLDYISNQTKLKLMESEFADANWIAEGAGPNSKNFELFYLTNTGINFIFPPYQVAAYAAGPQEVSFTYDELKDFIKDLLP